MNLRVILSYRRAFFPIFRHFFSLNFSIFDIYLLFSKCWNVNELDIFGSGEFHEW